ncbi:uncharacterized protein LOC142529310 [Primulina tabacum]|uniref:uncharacterized protein LOC142529310 n=1 Tax=Primulina tabacum TaxID=48773 RepID=UPI003F5A5AE3
MLTSQALVLATAMAASAGTIIIYNRLQEKYSVIPRNQDSHYVNGKQALKSCLSSGGKRRGGDRRKRVRFADDVKDSRGDSGDKFDKKVAEIKSSSCGKETRMSPNRVALYSGILKNRFQRMEYSC